jgi:hypothetical protein
MENVTAVARKAARLVTIGLAALVLAGAAPAAGADEARADRPDPIGARWRTEARAIVLHIQEGVTQGSLDWWDRG